MQDSSESYLYIENQKVNKYRAIFGTISIISGVALIAITLITSGVIVIPIVIGSYLIANGLINFKKI